MAATLTPARAIPAQTIDILTIEPDDVSRLRLPGLRSSHALRQELRRYPGRSVWAPATLEFAIVAPWRNRPEIACVNELAAVRHAEPLLRAAFERCVAHDDALFLALELETERSPTRYERAEMQLMEEVITYEMQTPRATWRPHASLRHVPVHALDERAMTAVSRIDREAFPWLWRNSRAEFDAYLCTPGVVVGLLESAGQPVAYIGVTHFAGWGHLDRIAVVPGHQGRGYGLDALRLAVDAMRRRGARRIGLSTQRTNRLSQHLYQRFGFRRTFENDYRLYGRWTHPDRDEAQPA
jgi:ribosomal protein S18 acetylase RimI-like enzyme